MRSMKGMSEDEFRMDYTAAQPFSEAFGIGLTGFDCDQLRSISDSTHGSASKAVQKEPASPSKYIPQIFAESRQIGLIGGVVLQVAYAARLP
jgi:hypothetical protein